MTEPRRNLFTRDDTFFGVCQGLSEDFGVPVDLIRIAFVPGLFLAPLWTIGAYFALGLVVFATHMLIRARPAASKAPALAAVETAAPVAGEREMETALQMAA